MTDYSSPGEERTLRERLTAPEPIRYDQPDLDTP